jgi:GH18 family chitinase
LLTIFAFDSQFLFNTSQKTVVTYDDTYSLGDKAAFAKTNGMAGCFTWSLDQVSAVFLIDSLNLFLAGVLFLF